MVTLPAVRDAQNFYRTYHRHAFDASTEEFSKKSFHEIGEERDDICQIALSSKLFLSAILFLFVAQCACECRRIVRRRRLLHQLPWLPAGLPAQDMVYEVQ